MVNERNKTSFCECKGMYCWAELYSDRCWLCRGMIKNRDEIINDYKNGNFSKYQKIIMGHQDINKTAEDWFKEYLSPSDAEKAIDYTKKTFYPSDGSKIKYPYFNIALRASFVWGLTKEGNYYWRDKLLK